MRVPQERRAFVYRHVVSFEETNVVGNVYFARHVAWQGRCREMFLREHSPGVLNRIGTDLILATLKVSCEYHDELRAFDEVELHMRLAYQQGHRIGLDFDYVVNRPHGSSQAARGFQEVGCLRQRAGDLIPAEIPEELAKALRPFA